MSSLLPKSTIARAVGDDATRRLRSLVAQCDGFRVWTTGGKLGVVEKVLVDEGDEPRELVVCGGVFRLRRVMVPIRAITVIDVRRRSVFADDWTTNGSPAAPSAVAGRQRGLGW